MLTRQCIVTMRRINNRLLLLGTLIVLLLGTMGCQTSTHRSAYTTVTGDIFATTYSIQYDDTADLRQAIDSTFATFSHSLNPFDSTSLISAINRNETSQMDSMIREVYLQSVEISKRSSGSYDVTCAPLVNLWGFGFEKRDSLSPAAVDSIRAFVGYDKVRVEGLQLIKSDPRMKFDFSSISKGYCSDLVGRMLERRGAKNYLVELGGELAFQGMNPQGESWIIGIDKPIDDPTGTINDFQVRIQLPQKRGGLATSGNYRNFKIIDGRKYAHTIDPKTGYPVQTDVLSATILAPSCMLADGLATACMTQPSGEVKKMLSHFKGVEYMIILGDEHGGYRTEMSPGFEKLVLK